MPVASPAKPEAVRGRMDRGMNDAPRRSYR
jgi:hypothetical protein